MVDACKSIKCSVINKKWPAKSRPWIFDAHEICLNCGENPTASGRNWRWTSRSLCLTARFHSNRAMHKRHNLFAPWRTEGNYVNRLRRNRNVWMKIDLIHVSCREDSRSDIHDRAMPTRTERVGTGRVENGTSGHQQKKTRGNQVDWE